MVRISKEFKLKAVKGLFKVGGKVTPKLIARLAYGVFFTRPFRHKPLPSDLDLIRMAEVLDINFENKILRGYRFGSGGKVVLLAHGWSSHALTQRKLITELVDAKDYTIIAFDAPAHGNSEGIHTNGMQYRRFLHKLISTYRPIVVVAHSLGGICTLSELPLIEDCSVEKVITLAIPITSTMLVAKFIEQASLPNMTHKHFEGYVEKVMGIDHNKFDLKKVYPNGIPYKGLIIHDTNDRLIPYTEGVKLSKMWPNAQFITTHNLDHSGVLKDKYIVQQIVDFITDKDR